MRKHFIAGNWKMYKTTSEAKAFAKEFKNLYKKSDAEVAVIAPFTQLAELKKKFSSTGIKIGAQKDRKSTRRTPVTMLSRMPSSA